MGRNRLIALRRDRASNWALRDPVLADGEPGFDRDSGSLRVGDGVTPWSGLPSVSPSGQQFIPGRDGLPLTCHPITDGAVPVGGSHTLTNNGNSFRVNSSAANSSSNREVWTLPGTRTDSEMRTLIMPPSVMNPAVCTPQMGHAHRLVDNGNGTVSAFIVDTNVFGYVYQTLFAAVWQWDKPGTGSLTIAAATTSTSIPERYFTIAKVRRVAGTPALDSFFGSMPGGADFGSGVPIVAAGCDDTTYNQSTNTLLVGPDSVTILNTTGQTAAKAMAAEIGTVKYGPPAVNAINPRKLYPAYVASRVFGKTLQVKAWSAGSQEPAWGATGSMFVSVDFTSSVDVTVPTGPGLNGYVVNHLQGAGNYVEYGDMIVKSL